MITIRKPLCFSEIGRKDNQEDFLYPAEADTSTRVFVLCDGMGGHDNGEVASRTAATALGDGLKVYAEVDESAFKSALESAYDALDAIDTNSAKKPGTTMTCVCLNADSVLVSHIGDSRIYQIRPSLFDKAAGRSGIVFQTADHSLVNDLLKAGELTEEEARTFPHKNVITRAMQPHLDTRYKADIMRLNDVRSGDYFFMCCDGVLEQLSNEKLGEILADPALSDGDKLAAIKAVCDGLTRDNYSCWLIPIDQVGIDNQADKSNIIRADLEITEPEPIPESETETDAPTQMPSRNFKRRRVIAWLLVAAAVIALMAGAFATYRYFRTATTPAPPQEKVNTAPTLQS